MCNQSYTHLKEYIVSGFVINFIEFLLYRQLQLQPRTELLETPKEKPLLV